MSYRKGFTLIELLIAVGIFTAVVVVFIAMLVTVTRVQVQQSSAAEVNQQSQFLLQQMQYYIAQSSVIDMPANVATTTLRLRMSASSSDPTIITLASGTLYLAQAGGALQPLSSSRVSISGLTFTKRSNAPSHDSVDIAFTLSYNTSNIQQAFSQILQTSVARVSAASFDSNLLPAGSGENVGVSGQIWNSINNIIDFSGSNVGINISSPQQALEVNGGLRLDASGSPTCNVSVPSSRGTFWVVESGSGVKDIVEVCVKNASDTYQWAAIY